MAAHVRDKDYKLPTYVLHYVVKNKHSNIAFNIQRLEPSKVCSNPVHLFMHYIVCYKPSKDSLPFEGCRTFETFEGSIPALLYIRILHTVDWFFSCY